jgi:hypothetical protein
MRDWRRRFALENDASFLIEDVSLAQMPNENFRAALSFWLDRKGGRNIPLASAINPLHLPRALLPFLIMISVEEGPKKLLFRVVGTGIATAIGFDPTGKFGEDINGAGLTNERFYAAMRTKKPYFYSGPLVWSSKDYKSYRSLVMPFGDEAGNVTRFLSYTEFVSKSGGSQAR